MYLHLVAYRFVNLAIKVSNKTAGVVTDGSSGRDRV